MTSERRPLEYPCGPAPATGEVSEICPGVMWLRMPLPMSLDHINLWAVQDEDGWAIFDTGIHSEQTVKAWRTLLAAEGPLRGQPVSRVFVTHMHPDHVGMAGWLVNEFKCELWMTFGEYMNCRVLVADSGLEAPQEGVDFYHRAGWDATAMDDYRARFGGFGKMIAPLPQRYRRVCDGQRLIIGDHEWHVVVGSGHSPEHASFHCPSLGLMIAGDQVLPRISPNVSVFPTEPDATPMEQWLASLQNVRHRVPDDVLVLPAHNEPFKGLHARMSHLEDSHLRALDRLQGVLVQGPKRVVDTFSVLFSRSITADVLTLATGESQANLNHLVQHGLAKRVVDDQGIAWYYSVAH